MTAAQRVAAGDRTQDLLIRKQASLPLGHPAPHNLYEETLKTVNETKYLGVTLQANLNWVKHINNICVKANRLLGILKINLDDDEDDDDDDDNDDDDDDDDDVLF